MVGIETDKYITVLLCFPPLRNVRRAGQPEGMGFGRRVESAVRVVLFLGFVPIQAGRELISGHRRSEQAGPRTSGGIERAFADLHLLLGPSCAAVATWFGYGMSGLRPDGGLGIFFAVILTLFGYIITFILTLLLAYGLGAGATDDQEVPSRSALGLVVLLSVAVAPVYYVFAFLVVALVAVALHFTALL